MITNYPIKKLLAFLTLVFGVVAVMASVQPPKAEPIDTLLQNFDRKPGLKTAREFFAYMDSESGDPDRISSEIGTAAGVVVIVCVIILLIWFRKRQTKSSEQLSRMMDELNEARRSSSVPEPEVPDTSETPEKEAPEEPEEYLTPEDKQFLKKLILSVTQMMNHQTVTVTQIADKMCMSPKTLNRRVQYFTGEAAKRYIMRIQLEQAKIMLLQNLDIPIVEIGNCCGFVDHSSFTRNFTRYVGMSPSDYRLKRGKG